jgi:hypothetical protein
MRLNQDGVLGAVCVLAGLILIFVWIPLDVESGIIEKIRSRKVIGDAMAPALAASLLIIAGLLLLITSLRSAAVVRLDLGNLKYLGGLILLTVGIYLLMRWTGPLLVALAGLFDPQLPDYRSLRDTVPWKYAGYLCGGTLMIFLLISFVERRRSWSRLFLSLLVCLGIALFYDLPFDDLLLPPNGDL